jgi:hypothetical protein
VSEADGTSFFVDAVPATERGGRPVATVIVDAEEDFDWDHPIEGTSHSTAHFRHLDTLHGILDAYGAVVTYLVTYPVLEDPTAVRMLRVGMESGRCALGIQLHPWVTPPFAHAGGPEASYSGNLDEGLEERKLLVLMRRFEEVFGFPPVIYRAGRYGIGQQTGRILEEHGFKIDTSIAPRTDFSVEGGPDYSGIDCTPFWFGRSRRVLELPLCRSVIGWGGPVGPTLFRAMSGSRRGGSRAVGAITRLRYAERVTLSPEGNDIGAMMRLVRSLLARGQHVLPISFHSSSLSPGRNPYVRSQADLHEFYDRVSALLTYLADTVGAEFLPLEAVRERYLLPAAGGGR